MAHRWQNPKHINAWLQPVRAYPFVKTDAKNRVVEYALGTPFPNAEPVISRVCIEGEIADENLKRIPV